MCSNTMQTSMFLTIAYVFAERRITKVVWQRVPRCRACNRKRQMTDLGPTVSWHDELMATCRAEPLMTGNSSRRLAAVHEVLRSVALQTPTNSHSELELDTLRNIQSMELAVEQMCQAAVELISSADYPSCCIQHLLKTTSSGL